MPYDGEYAGYEPLRRIVESRRVQELLSRARHIATGEEVASDEPSSPCPAPPAPSRLPKLVVAIDGSNAEVDVVTGYPGARVGYCTVASVLIKLDLLEQLDRNRPIAPQRFRETEQASAMDMALPGANIVTYQQTSARHAFRSEVYEALRGFVVDQNDSTRLLDTFEALLAHRPTERPPQCPYSDDGCEETIPPHTGHWECSCPRRKPLYSTDYLRIHERFRTEGTNGEAIGLARQICERLLLVHLLRCLEKQGLAKHLPEIAFFVDGPLGVFGPPAWLSAAISQELKRINAVVRQQAGTDLVLVGVEKTGTFVNHFEEVDQSEKPGEDRFAPQSYQLLTDRYIKRRIVPSESDRPYGQDTYFGRKFFYKTSSGARIVASLPFLDDEQDTIQDDRIEVYRQFPTVCALLDRLVCSQYPNSLCPLVSAHAEAAIPLNLGKQVLQELARALVGRP